MCIRDSSSGIYSVFLEGNTTYDFYPEPILGFTSNPNSISVTTSFPPQVYSNQNFGFCPEPDFHNLSIELSPYGPPRPGFDNEYQIKIVNNGSQTESGMVTFSFENNTADGLISFVDTDGGTVNGNALEWNFSNLGVFQCLIYNIRINLIPTTSLGIIFYPSSDVNIGNGVIDNDLADNSSTFEEEVVGSFDPNDKLSLIHI